MSNPKDSLVFSPGRPLFPSAAALLASALCGAAAALVAQQVGSHLSRPTQDSATLAAFEHTRAAAVLGEPLLDPPSRRGVAADAVVVRRAAGLGRLPAVPSLLCSTESWQPACPTLDGEVEAAWRRGRERSDGGLRAVPAVLVAAVRRIGVVAREERARRAERRRWLRAEERLEVISTGPALLAEAGVEVGGFVALVEGLLAMSHQVDDSRFL
mmetsp:Transcript_16922/g.55520  ORF Transcript_16922/g.55520 Transcript_16922/m.55520 type:complete len:213 (-) Transcript_16922:223-861(-)